MRDPSRTRLDHMVNTLNVVLGFLSLFLMPTWTKSTLVCFIPKNFPRLVTAYYILSFPRFIVHLFINLDAKKAEMVGKA